MKKYNVIYADPAWGFNKGVYQDNGRKDRLIDEQYPTMTKKELQQFIFKLHFNMNIKKKKVFID